MTITDTTSDLNGSALYALSQICELPGYVKEASYDELKTPTDIVSSSFADPQARRYPCHNPAATFLSAAMLRAYPPENEKYAAEVATRIDRFAAMWGNQEDIAQAVQAITQVKQAQEVESDDDYALVYRRDDGEPVRRVRLKSALEVRNAAEWLASHREHFDWPTRHTMARAIWKKAQEFSADLGSAELDIERMAGRGTPDAVKIAAALYARAHTFSASPGGLRFREDFQKLAKAVEENPAALSQSVLPDLAGVIDGLDRAAGLHKQASFAPAESLVFSLTFKQAEVARNAYVTTPTGDTYRREDFHKLSPQNLREFLGEKFARQVTKGLDVDPDALAEKAASISPQQAEVLAHALEAEGVKRLDGRFSLVELASRR